MSYYPHSPHPSQYAGSHHGHGVPVMYPGSAQGGYLAPQPVYDDGFSGGYGGGQPYVVSTPSSRSRRSRNWHNDSHRSHSRHGHGHSHGYSSHSHGHRPRRHHRSLGERILRWFGIGRHRSRSHRSSGWSLFGGRHRARYIDARTGLEVDKQGRPLYKV